MEYYQGFDKYLVAVDCIIFGFDENDLKVLILKRKIEPAKGKWSLMGGFIKRDESLDEGARRILLQLTGLSNIFMEQLHAFGGVARDPGARVISVAYYALIKVNHSDKELAEAHGAHWVSVRNNLNLIFDHSQMVSKALDVLRRRIVMQPIGFELLPEKFTLPQFQTLYEVINQEPLDKRNFRKRILETGLLEKLDEKEKLTSKKGAFYYRFNKERYEMYKELGFHFQLKPKKDLLIKVSNSVNESE